MSESDFLPQRSVICGDPIDGGGSFVRDGRRPYLIVTAHDACRADDPGRWAETVQTVNVELR